MPSSGAEPASRIALVAAQAAHVAPIARRMRPIDRLECAAFGQAPADALRIGLRVSANPLTALVDGRPEAMFGLVPSPAGAGTGTPWFLGTGEVHRHGRAMVRLGRGIVAAMLDQAGRRLENHVSAANGRAIRLLGAWGFTVEAERRMIGGQPFRRFWMER